MAWFIRWCWSSFSVALSQTNLSCKCKTTDMGLGHCVVCPFTSRLLLVLLNQPLMDGTLIWHWCMHHLTCGISFLLHSVNLILFTLLLVHLFPRISLHHLRFQHLSLPWSFTPDLKLISFTNPFLRSHSYFFRTAFTNLEPVLNKWALAFVCFSFVFFIFSGYLWDKLHPEILTGTSNKGRAWKTSHFLALNVNFSKTVGDTSIDTKIDDLGWPWTATRSNCPGISWDFTDLGANNG